ncbi:MAG: hypothetical protein KBS59_02735 [Clostridiales bacterium]|nr:hypothetical protein [Clostridiales bacterium]
MKKIVALLLAFTFCFGCVLVFQAFDGGQLEAEAADSIPPILFYLSGQSTGTEAVIDFEQKTVTFKVIISGNSSAFTRSEHCSSGSLLIKFDADVFDYKSCSGTFMGETSKVFKEWTPTNNTVSIDVNESSNYYYLDTELTVVFGFDDLSKVTDYHKLFTFDVSITSPWYSIPTTVTYVGGTPVTTTQTLSKTISSTVVICPHDAENLTEVKHDATCCEYAHTDTVCTLCGEVVSTKKTGNTYAAHVYDYEDIVRTVDEDLLPMCLTPEASPIGGITTIVKCKVCGKNVWVMDLEYHTNLDTSVKLYDSSHGYYYRCSGCGTKVECNIQKANPDTCVHSYKSTVTVEATCQKTGKITYTCEKCGNTYFETTPKLEHNFVTTGVVKTETCTESGFERKTCTVCGETTEIITDPLGHAWGESTVLTPATCQTPGAATHTCSRCGVTEQYSLPIDPSAHKFSTWKTSVEATCITQGVEVSTCEICGQTQSRTTSFGDHKYTENVIVPGSCYKDGVSEFTCEYCHTTERRTTPCTGHEFGPASSDGKNTVSQVCTKCGLTISVTTTSSKVTKTITCGAFALTINNTEIAKKDVDFRILKIADDSEEYSTNGKYLTALSASLGKNYSIQDAYHVLLYVDGVETRFTSDMTVTLVLGEGLKNAKTKIVYYEGQNGQTMIKSMDSASRKKLTVTIPGSSLAMSANDTLIVAVEGDKVDSGDPVTPPVNPPTPSTNGNIIVPIIIVALAVIITGAVVVIVIKSSKKQSF